MSCSLWCCTALSSSFRETCGHPWGGEGRHSPRGAGADVLLNLRPGVQQPGGAGEQAVIAC